MSNITLESLVAENRILKNQANQLRYFLGGSRVDVRMVSDVEYGQTLYCSPDALNSVAAGLLRPADVCLDIGPGVRPQRMLDCSVHVLVEPHRPYAEKLVVSYPDKVVYCSDGLKYFEGAIDKSTDTVFMLDVIEHLEKEDGQKLLAQALRVARKQVVIFTPLGFMPQHYTESVSWEGVNHSELQNHRSGWEPNEFANAIHVVCENYHSSGSKVYGAFYSIIDASAELQPRLVLVSDGVPSDFQFQDNDVIIADVMFSELSWKINYVPKRSMIVVPLELIAAENLTAREILRHSIINFNVLEGYLQRFKNVVALGTSAEIVLQRHRNGWS